MSCKNCDALQDAEKVSVAYVRIGTANVGLVGCDTHINFIIDKVYGRDRDAVTPVVRAKEVYRQNV